jgi:hypothetical protein
MASSRPSYTVRLTGAQLRVLRQVLGIVMNDPDWSEITGQRDWATLDRATSIITNAHVDACRAETVTPTR